MVVKNTTASVGVVLVMTLLGLFAVSIFFDLGLEGTDDRALKAIEMLRPEYEPWVRNLFEPGGRAEKALFVFQILLGMVIGWYCLARLRKDRNDR